MNELRWAFAKEKHVQPVILLEDKPRIGELVSIAPEDLKKMGKIDFVDVRSPTHQICHAIAMPAQTE